MNFEISTEGLVLNQNIDFNSTSVDINSSTSVTEMYEIVTEEQNVVTSNTSGRTVHHNSNFDMNLMVCEKNITHERRVKVIYTGGTIGMMRDDKCVLAPIPSTLVKRIRKYPNMHDKVLAEQLFGGRCDAPLILPYVDGESSRIVYEIAEYNPLLDSSNMTMQDWTTIAKDIQANYENYDGFVILHGTDTLSYTASALSFMLENLGKTVVLTGSQIPIFETRTDGRDNFISALIIAANYNIPEVCVLFGNKLLRGNRTVKMSSEALDAFDSPNVTPLAHIGITVDVDFKSIFRSTAVERFSVHSHLDENVGILRIFPSISTTTIQAFLAPPMRGVVLQSFGAGNIPANRKDLLAALKEATDRGVIIVNCTQCTNGSVSDIYETGKVLTEIGVIPGFDMTPETALTKLAYVLSKTEWTLHTRKQMMQTNLRGELTSNTAAKIVDMDLVGEMAKCLKISTPKEKDQLGDVILPSLVIDSVVNQNINQMELLIIQGADMTKGNVDGRTPLHMAVCYGTIVSVEYLLNGGASVHVKDNFGRTPLMEAIIREKNEITRLLIQAGAHIGSSDFALGEQLVYAAAYGLLQRLILFELAGADLFQSDVSGRTALHVAAAHGHEEIVQFLIKYYKAANQSTKVLDIIGFTPLDYAHHADRPNIINMLLNLNCLCEPAEPEK